MVMNVFTCKKVTFDVSRCCRRSKRSKPGHMKFLKMDIWIQFFAHITSVYSQTAANIVFDHRGNFRPF